jgi:hypothetical protein
MPRAGLEIAIPANKRPLTCALDRAATEIGFEMDYCELITYLMAKAVPWLRRLVAGLLWRRPGFAPESIHMKFVVVKVALGQVSLLFLPFSPVYIIPPWLSMLIYNLGGEQ